MGIAKRGADCLKAIYLNLSELNIKVVIKHSRSLTGKLIEIKRTTRKPFDSNALTLTSVKCSLEIETNPRGT